MKFFVNIKITYSLKWQTPYVLLTEPPENIKIIFGLFGETGADPVRARRREAHIYYLPDREPQFRDKPLDENLRRPVTRVPSRNIRTVKILYITLMTASAGFFGGN